MSSPISPFYALPKIRKYIDYKSSSNYNLLCGLNNSYLKISLENGRVSNISSEEMWRGYLTLGISSLFTKPHIQICGKENTINKILAQEIVEVVKGHVNQQIPIYIKLS